jgi:hypothetical protein
MEEHIRANAELVVQMLRPLSGIDFGYTKESVEWLEGFIERLRNSGEYESVDMKNKLTSLLGSFLGECIRCYGGSWEQHAGEWCVAFDDNNKAFPFAKVAKQIDNGLGDGIASFFNAMPIIFEDLPRAAPSTRRSRDGKFGETGTAG